MLDIYSREIIYELLKDGRSSNAAIAKKLGISVLTVAKKINAMTKDKVISIQAVPNPVKMGNYASALIGINIDIKRMESIRAELKKVPGIHIMVSTFGRFDLLLLVFFPNWRLLENFSKIELRRIDGVNSVCTFIISEMKMGYNVIFDNVPAENSRDLSEMEWELISDLMKDGRPQYAVLAKKLNTSTSTISRRITSLIEDNFIQIVAIPNIGLVNLVDAFIFINVDFSKIDAIFNTLAGCVETNLIVKMMNEYDIMVAIHANEPGHVYRFIERNIASLDGVLKIETFLVVDFMHFSTDALIPEKISHIRK